MIKITALFYENANGKKPVREWITSLSDEDKKLLVKI